MDITDNALAVLNARYLLKDEQGRVIETPEKMFARVARHMAKAETSYSRESSGWEEKFFEIMSSLRFLPNSPALINSGKDMGQLAACFVLPVGDSIKSIFDSLKNAALIQQSGGGTGFSFSNIRPKADVVRSTGGISSGPVSFMKIFNTSTDVIKQGGARYGANMGILRIDHPDILDFIHIKNKTNELTNFNVSVAITDAFMQALKDNAYYELLNPRTKTTVGKLKAKTVFNEIVKSAWENGDPGIVFIDRVNRDNPTPGLGNIESTNPCGEQPLLSYEACILGSINLSKYVKNASVGFEKLSADIKTAVRMLDNAIDVNKYPLPEIEKMHKGNRKIGIGVMGWADMLIMLGLSYADKKAFSLAREIMKFIRDHSRQASADLSKKRGVFPNFYISIYNAKGMPRLRNATTTTIAPTGTLSIIADCSSGIEPLFALANKRFILGTQILEINRIFFEIARKQGFYSDSLKKEVIKKGDLIGIKGIPSDVRKLFSTAHEIPPEDHIEMQACFQEFTDNAVSKTINMPNRAKPADVSKAFMLAYEKGCKGITVFRYGSKKTGTFVRFSGTD